MNTLQNERQIQTVCLLILTAIAVGAALYYLRPVLIPFVLAIFFTFCLSPVIDLQMRYLRIPRWLAFLSTLLLGVLILGFLGLVVSASVSQMSTNAHVYQAQITQLLDDATALAPLGWLGIKPEGLGTSLFHIPKETVRSMLSGTISAILNVLSNGLLVLIFMVFMLLGSTASEATPSGIRGDVQFRIERFILTKVLVSAATGVLVGTVLALLGVQFAMVFGLFAFLLNFIPNIGSVVSTLLPLPVVLLSPELSMIAKVLAISIPGLIQFTIGNLIEPKLLGESLDLHPITVLVALIFFGMIWGIVGMFLATPITAVTKILFERLEFTQPVANLMAGRMDAFSAETQTHEPEPSLATDATTNQ